MGQKPVPKALKGGHGERLRRRKQPQQAPSARGKQVMRSPPGPNFLRTVVHEVRVWVEGHHTADARPVALVDQCADPRVGRRRTDALHDDVGG